MTTKAQQILDRFSTWNQLVDEEPFFIVRAEDWRLVVYFAISTPAVGGRTGTPELLKTALRMKEWHDENEIPF